MDNDWIYAGDSSTVRRGYKSTKMTGGAPTCNGLSCLVVIQEYWTWSWVRDMLHCCMRHIWVHAK